MYHNPITGQKHRSWEVAHREIGKRISGHTEGNYEETVSFSCYNLNKNLPAYRIKNIFSPALEEAYVDFDYKGRGASLNYDLYAYDPVQGVAIIQARQAYRRAASHHMATRKTYFLCGQNEITGEYFRHPVSSHKVRSACKLSKDKARADVVRSIQCWLWEVTPKQLNRSTRQGDLLLVPASTPKSRESLGRSVLLGGSHWLISDEIHAEKGRYYALNPNMAHTKGQHKTVSLDGWYTIRIGREASAWDFAQRIGD